VGGPPSAGVPAVHMLFSASCPWYTDTDAINTWYGRPELPIGTIQQGEAFRRDAYSARASSELTALLMHGPETDGRDASQP
jgi:hypothetical protein